MFVTEKQGLARYFKKFPFKQVSPSASGPARMAEKPDVQPLAVAISALFAHPHDERAMPRERGGIDPFGHEQDLGGGDRQGDARQDRVDFLEVFFARDDEFQLKRIRGEPFAQDLRLEPETFMPRSIHSGEIVPASGVEWRSFRTHGRKVAGHPEGEHGARRFRS